MILERTSWTLRTMWPTGPTSLPKSWKIPLSDKKLYMPKKYMWGVSTIDDDTIKNICRLYVVREARLEICNMFMYIGG